MATRTKMADIVSKEVRSRMMSGIRSRDTRPELLVRKYLHAAGFRYSLRRRPDLPCQPDLVLPKYCAAIFVHGCFWHRHKGCKFATTPKTNTRDWERKFARNLERDALCLSSLHETGWRTAVIWECNLKRQSDHSLSLLIDWLRSSDDRHFILG